MPEVTITPLARNDLKGIGLFSEQNWGVKQRNLYLSVLGKTIDQLANSHRMDKKRNDIKAGLLSCSCREHMIFFRRDDAGNAEILRILSQSMDFKKHL